MTISFIQKLYITKYSAAKQNYFHILIDFTPLMLYDVQQTTNGKR